MIHSKRFFLLAALLLAAFAVVACGGAPAAPKAQPTAAPGGGGDSGATDFLKCENQKLPYPIMPGAQECKGIGGVVSFRTQASPEEVIKFYTDFFTRDGWKRETDEALVGMGGWSKGYQRAQVVTLKEGASTGVQIGVVTVNP